MQRPCLTVRPSRIAIDHKELIGGCDDQIAGEVGRRNDEVLSLPSIRLGISGEGRLAARLGAFTMKLVDGTAPAAVLGTAPLPHG